MSEPEEIMRGNIYVKWYGCSHNAQGHHIHLLTWKHNECCGDGGWLARM
jgi:hypothetical protein